MEWIIKKLEPKFQSRPAYTIKDPIMKYFSILRAIFSDSLLTIKVGLMKNVKENIHKTISDSSLFENKP